MPFDAGLVARVDDTLRTLGEKSVRQKNVFGGRGFMLGKSAFVIVWGAGLIVKTRAAEYLRLLGEHGASPFAPDGERAMSTWILVEADAVADDPELADWVRRGLAAVR